MALMLPGYYAKRNLCSAWHAAACPCMGHSTSNGIITTAQLIEQRHEPVTCQVCQLVKRAMMPQHIVLTDVAYRTGQVHVQTLS